MFDSSIPSSLLEMQKWFSHIITQPIQKNNSLLPNLGQDAWQYLAPSSSLSPRERIEIYHQQYWWRLLEVMHENFPGVTRLFGYREFNEKIAIPYLTAHPSNHFSLNYLGIYLPEFLEKHYPIGDDRDLVIQIARIDLMINMSVVALHKEDLISMDEFMTCPLQLQSHIYLFKGSADYLSFREEFIKHPVAYYEDNSFPELMVKPTYALIYRDRNHKVSWNFLCKDSYDFLNIIKEGHTLESACASLEERSEGIGDKMALWLFEWTKLQFFIKAD